EPWPRSAPDQPITRAFCASIGRVCDIAAPVDERIAVVGGGSIGVAWALAFARGGFDVAVQDPDPERRDAVPRELRERLHDLASYDLLNEPAAANAARVARDEDLGRT